MQVLRDACYSKLMDILGKANTLSQPRGLLTVRNSLLATLTVPPVSKRPTHLRTGYIPAHQQLRYHD